MGGQGSQTPAAAADAAFTVTGDRGENFRAAVTLSNPDERPVSDWTLELGLDRAVVQAFGAEAEEVASGRWRFRPVDWTRTIPAGGEIRFTFIGRPGGLGDTKPETKLDVTYAAETPVAEPPMAEAPAAAPPPAAVLPAAGSATGSPPDGTKEKSAETPPETAAPAQPTPKPTPAAGSEAAHTLGFRVKDAWADGFVAEVAVVNDSQHTLRPWRFEFALKGKIEQAWGAHVRSAGDGRWIAEPEHYNREIEPGSFATFGFKATGAGKDRPAGARLVQGE
ncbi:MAG: cellulose binding domain-containing protein [Alphaproteobacteria bacterium]